MRLKIFSFGKWRESTTEHDGYVLIQSMNQSQYPSDNKDINKVD